MSFPNIPDVDATIDLTLNESVNLLLASIAFEELGLSHIINAEAEKIQYVLGTIEGQVPPEPPPTIDDLLAIDRSVDLTLRNVIKNQMLLQFKLEDILTISTSTTTTTSSTTTTTTSSTTTTTTSSTTTTTTSSTTTTTTSSTTTTTTSSTTTSTTSTTTTTTEEPIEVGSAWSVGTDFGQGNAQYTTLGAEENEKTVDLGLGANHTPIGTVHMLRSGTDLLVTISTVFPYLMTENQLYVDDVAPTNSAPGLFPYQYVPGGFFTTHTFTVDVSSFAGETLFIAAHAKIFA